MTMLIKWVSLSTNGISNNDKLYIYIYIHTHIHKRACLRDFPLLPSSALSFSSFVVFLLPVKCFYHFVHFFFFSRFCPPHFFSNFFVFSLLNLIQLFYFFTARLFTPILVILVILIFQNGQNNYFVKYSFSFQHIQIVNSITVNCHSATVKSHFRFFLSHKTLF